MPHKTLADVRAHRRTGERPVNLRHGRGCPNDTDWRLPDALQRDGRATDADLGRLVGLSPGAVTERVRRLAESGVIPGCIAEVDAEEVGLAIHGHDG